MNLKNKKLFVFDLDGTVYLGGREIEGSYAAIDTLRALGKKVCFFTNNSSRMHLDYVEYLTSLGLKASKDEIYTSGQVAAEYILKNFPNARVFLLGNDRLREEFLSYGIALDDGNPTHLVLGFDTSLTYDRLYTFCKFLKRGLPYIATHPDIVCPAPECPMPDAGSMMELIRLTTDRTPDLIMGKPMTVAGERIAERYGVTADEVVMVGDRLYTDIAFGNNAGYTSVLVLSGETTADMLKSSDIQPDLVLNSVKELLKLI